MPEPVYQVIASNINVLSTSFHIIMFIGSCFVNFTLLLDYIKNKLWLYSLFASRTVTCFDYLLQGHMI